MEINGKVYYCLHTRNIKQIIGIFVNGVYQSKIQKQLKYEKQMKIMEGQILASAKEFFNKFTKTFAESDKKTYEENLSPFFAVSDDVKAFFKEPFPKYKDRPVEKWYLRIELQY